MRIAQINTYDVQGGAARASYRLHRGMQQLGQDSQLFVRFKVSSDPTVHRVFDEALEARFSTSQWSAVQRHYIGNNRTAISNTYFSYVYPGVDLTQLDGIRQADIINMHWVAAFQSPVTLRKILELGKPVVWTFHDMWAFTGGCHYASGCEGFQQACSDCPQLINNPHDFAAAILADKVELLSEFRNLTIVTASNWMADCVRKSRVLKQCRVETIPYSLETDLFTPISKAQAKQKLGISEDTFTFVTGNVNEIRKGFSKLIQALKRCMENDRFKELAAQGKVKFLCYGLPQNQLDELGLPFLHLGWRSSDAELVEAYTAADVLVLPSQEDNLPITMLEAMSCGTPVIAFGVGGMLDTIQDQVTGRLVPLGDLDQLSEAIIACAVDRQHCKQMGQNSRKAIEANHAMPIESQRYLALYEDLLSQHPASSFHSASIHSNPSPAVAEFNSSFGSHYGAIADSVLAQCLLSELDRVQLTPEQEQLQKNVHALKDEIHQLQTKLHHLQRKLGETQGELEAMKTSKFWKLRTQWFKLKQALGLPSQD